MIGLDHHSKDRESSSCIIIICGSASQNQTKMLWTLSVINDATKVADEVFLPEIRNKIAETTLERYGTENYYASEECKEKRKAACLQ